MQDFRRRLLRWYRTHHRRLPWRENPDPYRVWVSELMLQQTQVATVIPYYERFIARFPSVTALARATEQEVLAAWSGLGYYRRARALHEGARRIVGEGNGRWPEDVEGWMALPGVGRYTAGAIVSIALGKKAPILDGNVARVLARLFSVRGDPGKGDARRTLWRLAEEVLPTRSVGSFNQALMELGALVCLPQSPRCLVCPVRRDCRARESGLEVRLPEIPPRAKTVPVTMVAAVVQERGKLLLYQRTEPTLMKDLWEFPGGECRGSEDPSAALARESRERYGVRLVPGEEIARVKHSIMNRRITLHAFSAELRTPPGEHHTGYAWVGREEIDALPVSSMVKKVLKAMPA